MMTGVFEAFKSPKIIAFMYGVLAVVVLGILGLLAGAVWLLFWLFS